MNKQQLPFGNKYGEWENHRYDWDENDWQYEGKYLELEKQLLRGEKQFLSSQKKLMIDCHEDTERGPDYERSKGATLHYESRSHAFQDATDKAWNHPGGEAGIAGYEAAGWPDFGGYKPDYPGRQFYGQREGSVFSSKNSKGEGTRRSVEKITAKKRRKRT